jgi:hypothetical protein
LRKNASIAGQEGSDENSRWKPGLLNFGRRIESEPDPNSTATQDNGRAGGTVPRAAKVDESTEAERQTRRREERDERKRGRGRKMQTGARRQMAGHPI